MPLKQVLRSWLVRQPNRGDWVIIGSAAVTALTALPLAGLYVVVIAPLLLLPFGLLWILRPALGELGWPATAIAVTAVGVAVLGCLAYLNAYFWQPTPQSGLVMVIVPLYQVGIIFIVTFFVLIVRAARSDRQKN